MTKKLLVGLLSLALLIETILCIGAFFLPEKTFEQFGVSYNNETAFLGYIIAWFLLLVSILIGITIWQVLNNKEYTTLCYLLSFWWIGLGIGVYVAFKKPDNLFLDSAKGLILLVLTRINSKKQVV